MPTTSHKQQVLNRVLMSPKRAGDKPAEARPVLEAMIYAICREGTTKERADRAFQALQKTFFDWNEVRVSSARELEEVFRGLPHAEVRATRVVSLLQEIFETTYSFDLESLHKKGLKLAQKQLERYQGSNPFVVAYTMQAGLGGHALPLDADMQRTLRRLELLDGEPADESGQTSLEHLVPKARGMQFCETISGIAQDFCREEAPKCSSCSLSDVCPTSQANQRTAMPERAAVRSRARG